MPTSMDYVDRFLLLHPSANKISSRTYQLVAMTSLYLASKLCISGNNHAHSQLNIPSKRLVGLEEYTDLSSGQFTPRNIISMELCILSTLSWKMNPVSPICFTHHFLRLIEPIHDKDKLLNIPLDCTTFLDEAGAYVNIDLTKEVLWELSLYFTELAMSLPEITPYFHLDSSAIYSRDCFSFSPSTVAFASIILSMELISNTALPLHIQDRFFKSCIELTRQSDFSLHPDRQDVQQLKLMIKKSLIPDVFLNQATTENGQAFYDCKKVYPITIAMRYGLLKSTFVEELSSSRANHLLDKGLSDNISRSPSPTSSIDNSLPYIC